MGSKVFCWNGIYHGHKPELNTGLVAQDVTLQGLQGVQVSYPNVTVFQTKDRDRRKRIVDNILRRHTVTDKDTIVAHSYGCLIAKEMLSQGVKVGHLVLVAPAMSRDVDFPDLVDKITVFHNPFDIAIAAGSLLMDHPFGGMGRRGYAGKDERVNNIEIKYFNPNKEDFWNHSFYFDPEYRCKIVQEVVDYELTKNRT